MTKNPNRVAGGKAAWLARQAKIDQTTVTLRLGAETAGFIHRLGQDLAERATALAAQRNQIEIEEATIAEARKVLNLNRER